MADYFTQIGFAHSKLYIIKYCDNKHGKYKFWYFWCHYINTFLHI